MELESFLEASEEEKVKLCNEDYLVFSLVRMEVKEVLDKIDI